VNYAAQLTADGRVIIVHERTGVPLPVSIRAFDNADDADDFLKWLGDANINPRQCDEFWLSRHVDQWKREQSWPECSGAGCMRRLRDGGICDECAEEMEEAL
jgi:hypothetical protein